MVETATKAAKTEQQVKQPVEAFFGADQIHIRLTVPEMKVYARIKDPSLEEGSFELYRYGN